MGPHRMGWWWHMVRRWITMVGFRNNWGNIAAIVTMGEFDYGNILAWNQME
ncbi:MAG: hypothetical protein ACMUIL_07710 [bacterium]